MKKYLFSLLILYMVSSMPLKETMTVLLHTCRKKFAGTPAMQLNAVLVSADYQRMEKRITSSLGYASMNMINSYTSMGEDGGRAAQQIYGMPTGSVIV